MFADEFQRASLRLMNLIRQFGSRLSKRDLYMMQIGMRASHIEEALAQGDIARARGHLDHLTILLRDVK